MDGIGPTSLNTPGGTSNAQEMRDRMLARVDTDQNGKVSFEEIAATERGAQFADQLQVFDTDDSGDLSAEELSQMQQKIAEKVREQIQAAMLSGTAPQTMIDDLLADKDD